MAKITLMAKYFASSHLKGSGDEILIHHPLFSSESGLTRKLVVD